jgi:hypothetical protein
LLPEETVGHIFGWLDLSDLLCRVALVSKEWYRLEHAVRKYRHSLDLSTCEKFISDNVLTRLCTWFPSLTSLNLLGLSRLTDTSMRAVGTLTNLKSINFTDTSISDDGLEQLSGLYKLEKIFLSSSQTSLRPLSTLSNLRSIVTIYHRITDNSLRHLSLLTKLETLSCRSAVQIKGYFLPSLSSLTNLTFLALGPNIESQYLSLLAQFTKLISLDIHDVYLTQKEVQSLTTLTRLRYLNISGNRLGFDDSVLFSLFSAFPKLEAVDLGLTQCRTKTTLVSMQRLTKLRHLDLENTQITDDHMFIFLFLTNLEELTLGKNKITNKTLVNFLLHLSKLNHLNLSDTEIDENGIASYLSPFFFPNLQSLDLSGIKLSDKCLVTLARLSTLTALTISGTDKVTNQGLQFVSKLSKLQSLTLTDCKNVSDNGLCYLSSLIHLRTLFLSLCQIGSSSLFHLSCSLTNLVDLRLIDCPVNDEAILSLTQLKQLQRLFLDSTHITDNCVDTLLTFKCLKTLGITDTSLSKNAKEKLAKNIAKVITDD